MDILIRDDGLLLDPETDFEAAYLQNKFPPGQKVEAFLKHGMNASEVVGLVIRPKTDSTR